MGSHIKTKEFTLKVIILMVCAGLGVPSAAQAQDTTKYTYDALGRLVSSKIEGSQNVKIDIHYDAAGNRIDYAVSGAANGSGDPGASAGVPTAKKFIVVPLNGFTIIPIS